MSFANAGWGAPLPVNQPTNSTYVDLTNNQTVAGAKTFTTPPLITSPVDGADVIVDHTGSVGFGAGFGVKQDGTKKLYMGYNPTSTDTYLWAYNGVDLKFGTNNTERLRIKANGLSVDNTGTVIGKSSTTLCLRDNIVDTSTSQTLTNKTIAYGSNTITGLPVSSTGYAAYYILNNQSISNSTETTVAFDTAIATDSGITNSPSGTFTVNTTGIYTISATVAYAANATGYRFIYFKLNSSPIYYSEMMVPNGHATNNTCVHSVFTGRLTAGDVIKVITAQLSGGALNIIGYNTYAGNNVSMVQITRTS